jgi:tRNA-binding protein
LGYDPPALATLDEFLALDLRVGTVVSAEVLRGARTPAFALRVDFGILGIRTSSVEIADLYEPSELVGLQVIGVINLPAKNVAGMQSQVPLLSADNGRGERILLIPERPLPDGAKVR